MCVSVCVEIEIYSIMYICLYMYLKGNSDILDEMHAHLWICLKINQFFQNCSVHFLIIEHLYLQMNNLKERKRGKYFISSDCLIFLPLFPTISPSQ